MPGNEVGDRVHNFFGQENLSHGQHHSQAIDGNWPGLSNNLWVGGQRQIGGPFISSLKNYNVQQPDPERGHGSQSSHMPHGLNFTQSNLKPEFGRVQSPNHQPALNGYVHGNHVYQTRQNEANFLGVDTDTNRHNLVARGVSMSQQVNGAEHNKKHSMRLDASESPVSFDFFGGQQQMSSQHLNVLQSMPRQQTGNSDMQLLQRHVMLAQLQEFHRQQQLQQLESRQQNVTNQVPSFVKQTAGNHSPSLINGVPINEASNNLWQPELVASNANWLQRGASPVIQGSSSGQVFSPEQGQGLRLMDTVPQQAEQSLYGVPIPSTSGTPGSYSHIQMDKAAMQQISANNNSLSGNMYATFPGQVSMQEGARQDFQGKNTFGSASGQGLSSGFNLENLQQANPQQRSPPMQEFQGRQEVTESSEQSHDKSFAQVSSSQNVATLDPAEEKILFGSDDNIWEAFGRNTNMGMGCYNISDASEYSGGFPVVQSGSWSALMQSAVAETSSGDTGIQEEWCGPSFQNSEPPTRSQQPSTVNHGGKPEGVWGDNNFQLAVAPNSRPSSLSVDANRPSINSLSLPQFQHQGFRTSQVQGDVLQTDSSQRAVPKFSEQENKWSDRGPLQKQSVEGSQIYASVSHPPGVETNANSNSGSWTRQQSTSSHNSDTQLYNRANGWNFIDSMPADGGDNFRSPENKNSLPAQSGDCKRGMHDEMGHAAGIWRTESIPNTNAEPEHAKASVGSPQVGREVPSLNNIAISNSSTMRPNQESRQQLPSSQKLDFWKVVDSSVNSKGGEVLGKNQHNLGKSPKILESSGNTGMDRRVVETHEVDNFNDKDNSTDGFRSSVLHHTSTAGSKENAWSDVGDSRTFPGGKQKLSGNGGRRPSGIRKFQYHPMGDVDVDNEPSYGAKHGTHSQTLPQQVSRGIKGYDQGSFGQSKFGQTDKSSLEMEKGHLPGVQGDTKGLHATTSKNMFPGFAPVASAPFDRGMGNYAPNQVPPSSQHMLELLHKVDHPREHGSATRLSSSERNMSSEMPEAETSEGSVGHVQRNQPSTSQNFGLQLAPPSQRLSSSDHAVSSQSYSHTGFGSAHVMHEVGEKGPMQLASRASTVPVPSSYEPSQGHGNNISTTSGQVGNKASFSNIQGSYATTFASGFPYGRNLENQNMHAASGRIMANQSVNLPFSRLSSGSKQLDGSSEIAQACPSVPLPMPDVSASTPQSKLASSIEAFQLSGTDQTPKQSPAQQILESDVGPPTQPSVQQGTFSKVLPNAWTSVPRQQLSLTAQPSKMASSSLKSQLRPNSSSVTTFPASPKLNEQDSMEGRNGLPGIGVISANSQSFAEKEQQDKESSGQQVSPDKVDTAQKTLTASLGKESVVNHFSETSVASHAATQRDIEAFGRSLRPDNSLHQNYSLLHQVQAMKSTETDSTDRSTKRLKGPDFGMDPQHVGPGGGQQSSYGYNITVRDSAANHTSIPSGDSKMLSFSSKLGDNRDSNSSSQDMFQFNQNSSNNFPSGGNAPSIRGEPPQISPQMAPSWFDQYGTFKNGQMLPVYDMQRSTAMKSAEQPFVGGKLADDLHARGSLEQINASSDGSKLGSVLQVSTPTLAASEHLTSSHLMPRANDQSLLVVRPKKRKSATSELLPWHKELMKVSQRLQTISMAEAEWAKATNRLAEKVEDEAEMVEDAPPGLRLKRRLILTTQLMQQLLHPPPAAVLSSDMSLQYESVAYFSARLTLGDACSAVCCSASDDPSPADSKNLLPEKLTTPVRIDKYYSKVVEDFIGRAKKLESDLLRLDKRASILDLRVECQDLEKFSVINRFARFHGRGQADAAESSSSDGSLNAQKSCPQKYVTGLPMPRNLPDRVKIQASPNGCLNIGQNVKITAKLVLQETANIPSIDASCWAPS